MKVGVFSLMLALAMTWSCASSAQEKEAKKEDPKPAAKEEKKVANKPGENAKEKPAEKPAEKPVEKPAEKPATAADFPAIFKKWNEVDKQLNELGEKYQFAPSSEERGSSASAIRSW